jgi:hypothetical protein
MNVEQYKSEIMNPNLSYPLIDRSPWLSVRGMKRYLDYKSATSVRNFIHKHRQDLNIKRIKGGQIRVKQSSIDNVLEDI